MKKTYVIGLDFGTDSARALLVDAVSGKELDTEVVLYPRWNQGLYSDFSIAQFRHHPQDYIEVLEQVVKAVTDRHPECKEMVAAISVDTTASTPCLTDKTGTPLAMLDKYKNNPNAMFVIWKDHTSQKESDEINALLKTQPINYACFTGNHYSPECFWTKVLHLLRSDKQLAEDAWSVIEACDFIPNILTGNKDASKVVVGHCIAGAKWMWSDVWGGYPPESFFEALDPILLPIRRHLSTDTRYCTEIAGHLSEEWADRLGLPAGIPVGTGNIDSHSGAIGAGITDGTLVMNLGTSACFMSVMPKEVMGTRIVDGIFGQVDGSILKGEVGFESGLSAFGDGFAWFRRLMSWPLEKLIAPQNKELAEEAVDNLLIKLAEEAEKLNITIDSPLATDWLNGRRSPYPDNTLTASFTSIDLSTKAPELYYALVESTCFATKRVVDHLVDNDIVVDKLVGIGGIPRKSPFVMQMLADTLGRELNISACKQAGAMGSVIHASVIAGLYPNIPKAQKVLCRPIERTYIPVPKHTELLARRYKRYISLGTFTENEQEKTY